MLPGPDRLCYPLPLQIMSFAHAISLIATLPISISISTSTSTDTGYHQHQPAYLSLNSDCFIKRTAGIKIGKIWSGFPEGAWAKSKETFGDDATAATLLNKGSGFSKRWKCPLSLLFQYLLYCLSFSSVSSVFHSTGGLYGRYT
ncbi:hypothetical protein F4821DRAFT_100743 [Hypoxylon rubiginosum]|uniref:Uncharacterized protein n=1 Tax=Hypoxylon rubiginosum TaxID=110542 RepID=A0ACC0D5I9_9PEZI|nr:hypothetical protein F4821DRAFT_100743 [Hypoxylon rubiginosum]